MKYINLGLPSNTLWADCNVGARELYEYGIYLNFKEAQQYGILPTKEQMMELVQYTTQRVCRIHSVKGILLTGANGNSIFMPFAGYLNDGGLYDVGDLGDWWSCTSDGGSTYCLCLFHSGYITVSCSYHHSYGHSVRLIKNK